MQFYSVRLLGKDFDACFRSYREIIGLEPVWGDEGGRYADFRIGDKPCLSLFKRKLMAASVGTGALPSHAPAQDRAAIVLQIDDLEETGCRQLIGFGLKEQCRLVDLCRFVDTHNVKPN